MTHGPNGRPLSGAAPAPLVFAFVLLISPAFAQIDLGPEFVLNQTTQGDQWPARNKEFGTVSDAGLHFVRAIDELTNGTRVVAYYDANDNGHRVVLLDADDAPITEIDLGTDSRSTAAVAALTTGGFVAAYCDKDVRLPPKPDGRCQAEIFDNSGTPSGAPIELGFDLAQDQFAADVAALPGGDFVVAWWEDEGGISDGQIYVRRFDNSGVAITTALQASNEVEANEPVVEALPSGGFVVLFDQARAMDMRPYGADNAPLALQSVQLTPNEGQRAISAAVLSDGNIAVSYKQDAGASTRSFQVVEVDGTVVVPETVIPSAFRFGDLASLPDGRFVSVHVWGPEPFIDQIRLAHYANDGTLLGTQQVNLTPIGLSGDESVVPRIGAFDDGDFLITFGVRGASADGSGSGVLARSAAVFKVGGQVSGLRLPGLVLALEGRSLLGFDQDNAYEFPISVPNGEQYAVSVSEAPRGHNCVVANAIGTVNGADVTDVDVACTTDIEFADGFETLATDPVAVD